MLTGVSRPPKYHNLFYVLIFIFTADFMEIILSAVSYKQQKGIYINLYENRIIGKGLVKEMSNSQVNFNFEYYQIYKSKRYSVQYYCKYRTKSIIGKK